MTKPHDAPSDLEDRQALEIRRPPVMADVARLAGVSIQTVSRVLNDGDYVAAETRARVRGAVEMIGYQPNAAARTLVTGRSRTIGVASFDTALYGPASTLAGIERAAHAEGYFTSIVTLQTLDRKSLTIGLERLQQQGADGILVIAPLTDAVNTLPLLAMRVPLVAVETGPDEGVPVIAIDQHAGAALATQHLLDLGHPTVHHLAGPPEFLEAHERLRGWRDTLQAAHAPVPATISGDWSARSGYRCGQELLRTEEPSAIFCANDQMTLGLLRALTESGRLVPRDTSVVGFDDVPEAEYFNPSLTTVRQDFRELGRRGLQLLLDQITGVTTPGRAERLAPQLVIRASTSTPPPCSATPTLRPTPSPT